MAIGQGAIKGAIAGSVVPGLGNFIGAGVGALSDIMGSGKSGVDTGMMETLRSQRMDQINNFSNALAQARQEYLNQMTNFNNNTFQRYMPQLEAALGARGLQASGGAFNSGLGRAAAGLQGDFINKAYDTNVRGLEDVNNAYMGAYGQAEGLAAGVASQNAGYQNQANQAEAGGISSLIGAGLNYATGNYGLNNAIAQARMKQSQPTTIGMDKSGNPVLG